MHLHKLALAATVAATFALALAVPAQAANTKPTPAASNRGTSGDASARSALSLSKVSPASEKTSSRVSTRVTSYVKAHGTRYDFGSYTDSRTGKAVLETNAPAAVVTDLVGKDANSVTVKKTAPMSDHFSRRDDVPSFWGGGGITLAGTAPSARCSSGYTVKNANGTKYMVTAGHCFTNGQQVVTELGGRFYGYVYGNGLPSQDMELIYGSTYSPYIFNGGVNSTTGWHIASAADPVVGYANYCHSGRTTGENCGHTVISTTATVCTSSGCKSPVAAFQGGYLPQGGDSGSPLYVGSTSGTDKHIRGHIIAGNGTTEYAEKWSRVATRFGVTIATS